MLTYSRIWFAIPFPSPTQDSDIISSLELSTEHSELKNYKYNGKEESTLWSTDQIRIHVDYEASEELDILQCRRAPMTSKPK